MELSTRFARPTPVQYEATESDDVVKASGVQHWAHALSRFLLFGIVYSLAQCSEKVPRLFRACHRARERDILWIDLTAY